MMDHIKICYRAVRIMALLVLLFLTMSLSAQTVVSTDTLPESGGDSGVCISYTSQYRTCIDGNDIDGAIYYWRQVLAECPALSEELYVDGEALYLELFGRTEDLAYIDSVLMLLTQRSYYFEGRASNELHKAELLLDLAGDDPLYLGLCYNIIAEAADMFPEEMGCSHFVLLATVAASLWAMDMIGDEELADAFVKSISTLDNRIGSNQCNSGYAEDLNNLETFFRTCGAMRCSDIERLFAQKVNNNPRDKVLIDRVFGMLDKTGCSGEEFYYSIALKLFANDRSAANAVRLAELNAARNNIERSVAYFTEAYNCDTTGAVRSEVILRVAEMELARGNRQAARDRAEHAFQLNKRNAGALMLLAECYAGAELGTTFDNHTAYWVAVDYLEAAIKVDPSLRKEAEGKIRAYSQLFPTREECFYRRILDEGIVFNVGSWISEVTRVRFRRE
jgi:tetratricopeptide (TPR) repeat protein